MAKAEYRSAIRSRRLINQAVAELMQEKPLDKISVTDVVRRADINRGTFYAHYADVSDVLEHQADEACQALRQTLDENLSPGGKPDPAVVLRQIQHLLEGRFSFFTTVLASSLASSVTDQLRAIFVDYMTEHLPDELKENESYLFALRFAAGGITTMYMDWAAGKLPMTLKQLTDHAIELCKILPGQIAETKNR